MSQRYAYDIATTDVRGDWTFDVSGKDVFVRDPRSTARSLLERWIHDNYRQLAGGGRVLVLTGAKAATVSERDGFAPNVRVRVFRTHDAHTRSLAAIAYLARVERDDSTDRQNGRGGRWRLRWEYRRHAATFLPPHHPAVCRHSARRPGEGVNR